MYITFHEPKPLDLQELARVTEASLLILEPWYKDDHERSLALQSISTQARKYTLAIEDSVKAAQYGHDVAENALRLSDLVKREDVPKEECDNFAKIMLKYASDAYQRSSESLEKFRNVRQDLSELISNAREADDHVQSDLDKLENEGIPVFEKLVKCVGHYIDWWNWIALGASAQKFSAEQLTFKYSKIRSESTIKKWRELKASFVQYTIEIAKVQDDHSKLFLRIAEEQTPTSEAELSKYQYQDVAPHSQIARMRSDRKRRMSSRFWNSVSSFIRGVFCL